MYDAQSYGAQEYGANTSGQGEQAIVPPEVQGWNWGAFLLSWIWGIGNNVMIALLALIIPFWSIYLGVKGNELAWRSKRYDSVEHFKATQAKWTRWGVIYLVAVLLFVFGCVALSLILAAAGNSSS